LAKSVKAFHPDWWFVLLLSDHPPSNFNLANEPFDELVVIQDLGIENFDSWVFKHSIVELCTAVKGRAAVYFSQREDVDKIIYLDPDTRVYSSLADLEAHLQEHSVLLTPHLLQYETEDTAIIDNEISVLKHGLYNLGFMAANSSFPQGLEFLKWWAERLNKHCFDDIPGGLFTDQKWCDLAPIFFDQTFILRDPGYNVATWNIAHRALSLSENQELLVAGSKLKFYHYTVYDSGDGKGMLMKYASDQSVVLQMWDSYGDELKENGNKNEVFKDWFFGSYESGNPIPIEARKLYRAREDLIQAFPNPFGENEPSYESWYAAEVERGNITTPLA
jgi:hypothetical protein